MSEQQRNLTPPDGAIAVFPSDNEKAPIDMMELLFKLLVNWKLILCMAIIFAVAAGVYTEAYITPMYRATSVIFVLNRDSAINMSDLQLGTALTNDYIKLFSMWEVKEQVIKKLDLPYSYGALGGMVSVSNASNTRMLDISVTCADPQQAADIANAYAEVASDYIVDTMKIEKPTIMSRALVPGGPISPNKSQNITVGFVLGAALAAGIVILRTLLDDKYKNSEDIRKYTGLVTLAVIPKDEEIANDKKSKSKKSKSAGGKHEKG